MISFKEVLLSRACRSSQELVSWFTGQEQQELEKTLCGVDEDASWELFKTENFQKSVTTSDTRNSLVVNITNIDVSKNREQFFSCFEIRVDKKLTSVDVLPHETKVDLVVQKVQEPIGNLCRWSRNEKMHKTWMHAACNVQMSEPKLDSRIHCWGHCLTHTEKLRHFKRAS